MRFNFAYPKNMLPNLNLRALDLAIIAQCCISYKNQSFDLHYNSNDWFLYEMQHWAEMG